MPSILADGVRPSSRLRRHPLLTPPSGSPVALFARTAQLKIHSAGVCYVDRMPADDVMPQLREFVRERDWAQFHSPENLAKSISIEAGELLECFQWSADADRAEVEAELADVLTYAYLLADRLGADPHELMRRKLAVTQQKYPVKKARGRSTRYDRL